MKAVKRIGVIGAGLMGGGIAQVAAQAGFEVVLKDVEEKFLERGLAAIKKSLDHLLAKGKITLQESDETLGRIRPTLDLHEVCNEADVIIEAVPESKQMKMQIFKQLDEACPTRTVLASNTSSLSITEISAATLRPEKVIGMHFASPVPVMRGVEIIRTAQTSEETMAVILSLAKQLGKEAYIAKDFPGFSTNRLLPLFLNEAFHVLMQGISSAEDIDKGIRLNLRHPMGPLELADFIGLDTLLSILEYLHQEIGERYRPCPLLKQLVLGGFLGVKTGKGVYDYVDGTKKPRPL